jgi:hypothetical protein
MSMLRLVIGTGLGTGTASSRTGVCQAARLGRASARHAAHSGVLAARLMPMGGWRQFGQ